MNKFKLFLSVMAVLLLSSTAIMAQESKGYALFGAVLEGYTDLTSKVTIEAVGSATFLDGVFTGAGLPGRICESGNYFKMSFTEPQALTLTEDFEVHVVLAKAEAAAGNVQVAFCNNGWSAARLGYIIPNASINLTATDIVLKYKDSNKDNYNTHPYPGTNEKFIGVNFQNEIFRLCAATGEQFEITQIYIEQTYTPEPEFDGETRYYFFSSRETLPAGEKLVSVDLREGKGTTIGWNNMVLNPEIDTYSAISINDVNSYFSFNQNLKAITDMSAIADGGYLVIKMRSNLDVTKKNFNVRLCNNVSYVLDADDIAYFNNTWNTIVFNLADAQNHPVFNNAMNGTIFQLHSDEGVVGKIDIDFAYLTNDATNVDEGTAVDEPDPTPDPEPTQDPAGTRYYIVGEGSDATLHKSVDCTITYGNDAQQDNRVSDYYSMKTGNHDWTAITFKSNTTVANTIDAYGSNNWHLVMRFRSSIDNWIFFDKNFRVNLMNDASNYYLRTSDFLGVETLGDGQWHTVKFKLSDAAGTVPTQFLQADQIAVQLYVPGNGNYLQKDEFFDIDYLYFTNDPTEDPNPRTDRKILLHDNRINNDNYATLLEKNNGNTVDVDLNRSFVADGAWYTLCLPFSMTADQVNAAFGACKLAKLNGSELRGSSLIHLNFDYVNTIEAGVPYLFMPMADVNPVIIEDVVIDNTLRHIVTDYFSMKGIFYPTHVTTGDYFLGTDNYLIAVKDGDSSNLKGLRAYFTIGTGAPASARARVVMAPTVATDLQENTITTTAEKVIIDGTIYILRGDKIYTTTGQLVK